MNKGFNCSICQTQLDTQEHKPILGCKHFICYKCFQEKGSQPQSQSINCQLCDKDIQVDINNPVVTDLFFQMLEENCSRKTKHSCSKHKEKEIEFICHQDNEIFCSLCLLDHLDHHKNVTVFTSKEIQEKSAQLNDELEKMKQSILKNQEILFQIFDGQKNFESNEIIDCFKNSIELLSHPFVKNKEEIDIFGDILVDLDSKILTLRKQQEFVKNHLIGGQNLSLVYRGSRDGFNPQDFRTKCVGKAKTITFVKTDSEKIIGGYTSVAWTNENYVYKTDEEAYVFTVDHEQKYSILDKTKAVYHALDYGPTFGDGHTLYIADQNDAYFRFDGTTYQKADGDASYLAQQTYFKVMEIEVFSLI